MWIEPCEETECFMHGLERRNPGELEFHQAVREFVETVMPFVLEHRKYKDAQILERMATQFAHVSLKSRVSEVPLLGMPWVQATLFEPFSLFEHGHGFAFQVRCLVLVALLGEFRGLPLHRFGFLPEFIRFGGPNKRSDGEQ